MKKIIRRIGDSIGIIFNKEEAIVHSLVIGKIFEVELKGIRADDTSAQSCSNKNDKTERNHK